MAKGRLRKTDRVCALCRNWNGTVGSTTIQPVLGGGFQVEMKEKKPATREPDRRRQCLRVASSSRDIKNQETERNF